MDRPNVPAPPQVAHRAAAPVRHRVARVVGGPPLTVAVLVVAAGHHDRDGAREWLHHPCVRVPASSKAVGVGEIAGEQHHRTAVSGSIDDSLQVAHVRLADGRLPQVGGQTECERVERGARRRERHREVALLPMWHAVAVLRTGSEVAEGDRVDHGARVHLLRVLVFSEAI